MVLLETARAYSDKKRVMSVLRFLVRGVLGSVCIYGLSFLSAAAGLVLPVGINLLTFLCCALLGVPGLLLVYGLSFIQMYV